MRNKVQILSVNRNVIVVKVPQRAYHITISLCSMILCSLVMIFAIGGTSFKDVGRSMCYIYNPVNSLYSDNSGIVFASVNAVNKESLNFSIPIAGAKSRVDNTGAIIITVGSSIMVKACEAGVVESVGESLDGKKYVKVLHCLDVSSVIENIDVVGVEVGDIVKKGQDIATAKEGSEVVLWIRESGEVLKNLQINQSKIVWEK